MIRRRSVALAFAAALVAGGNLVCAQASTPGAAHAAVAGKTGQHAPQNSSTRPYTEDQMLALSTAEMIYMHESLVSGLVFVAPAAMPVRPARRCRSTVSPAIGECS